MRQVTIEYSVYTVRELKEQFPKGFEKALDTHREQVSEDTFISDEVFSSLKALIKACGFEMKDWSLGAYSRNSKLKVCGDEGVEELSGKRALAWLENTVLSAYRVPYEGKERKELAKYGSGYRPGQVKPCPFTGICFDEDFLDDLKKNLKSGMTIKDALQSLDSVYSKLVEDDIEYRSKEESFIEDAEANQWEFTSSGSYDVRPEATQIKQPKAAL